MARAKAGPTRLLSETSDAVRARVARRLERGSASALPNLASAVWRAASDRSIARPLTIPSGAAIVGVGSAVLGGAGKTPVAIALTRALAAEGAALIGHAYRASPEAAGYAARSDAVTRVGDDASWAARLLDGVAPVIVARTRQAAIDFAATRGHRLLVVDGLLQARPSRLALSLLVVDAAAPWGGGACPPAGDLRASREALAEASDVIAAVHVEGTTRSPQLPAGTVVLCSRVSQARATTGEVTLLSDLRAARVGLLVAVARPARIVRALAAAGVSPVVRVELADHAAPGPRVLAKAARAPVDVWLTTARCATKLPTALGGRPVLALDHTVDVAPLIASCWGGRGRPC